MEVEISQKIGKNAISMAKPTASRRPNRTSLDRRRTMGYPWNRLIGRASAMQIATTTTRTISAAAAM